MPSSFSTEHTMDHGHDKHFAGSCCGLFSNDSFHIFQSDITGNRDNLDCASESKSIFNIL